MRVKQRAPKRTVRTAPRTSLQDLPDDVLRHVAARANNQTRARMEATSRRLRTAVRDVVMERDPAVRAVADMIRDLALAVKHAKTSHPIDADAPTLTDAIQSRLRPRRSVDRVWNIAPGIQGVLAHPFYMVPRVMFLFNLTHVYALTVGYTFNKVYTARLDHSYISKKTSKGIFPAFYIPGSTADKAMWALERGLELYNANPITP